LQTFLLWTLYGVKNSNFGSVNPEIRTTGLSQAQASQDNNVTDRWKSDMASDSWLSKNVRPGTLVYLLTAYLIFALLDGYGYKISESYVNLLGQWGMLVMTAYFGGRTVEKVMEMRKGGKE
jgi:hypothetical protein